MNPLCDTWTLEMLTEEIDRVGMQNASPNVAAGIVQFQNLVTNMLAWEKSGESTCDDLVEQMKDAERMGQKEEEKRGSQLSRVG